MLRSPDDYRKALAGHQPRSLTERIQAGYIEHLERRVTELEWLNDAYGGDRGIPFLSKEPAVIEGPITPELTIRLPLRASIELKPDEKRPEFHGMLRSTTSDGPAVSLSYYLSEQFIFGAHDAVEVLVMMHEQVIRDFAQALTKR